MNRVMHFEIHADDTARAIRFYREAFGWKIEKWNGPVEYWNVTTGPDSEPGINGGLMKRQGERPKDGAPCNAHVCTIVVENVDAQLDKVKSLGAKQVVDKMAVPTIGWLAYCTDTEGNIFGMLQPARDAKD